MATVKSFSRQSSDSKRGAGIRIVTKPLRLRMNQLQRRRPIVFKRMIGEWLEIGGEKIRFESVKIASVEAKGASNQYMQGFIKGPVKQASEGTLYIKILNKELYSMVIEYGGRWGKMPPPHIMDQWIMRKFNPANKLELKRIAFAIGKAISQNKHRGRGQRFRGAKGRTGRVFTMNRALRKSQKFLQDSLGKKIDEGIRAI